MADLGMLVDNADVRARDGATFEGRNPVTGEVVTRPAAATVLDHVGPGMRIDSEESFGPVVCVIRARGVDEAVRIANDVNGPTVSDEAQMPFGGVKASGYGRFGGRAAIDEFTDLRWITIEDPGRHYPF